MISPDQTGLASRDRRVRTGLPGLIARYPMTAFFVLAFGLSWSSWTGYVVSQNGLGLDPGLRFPDLLGPHSSQLLGVLPGAYLGPITAAFIVTAVTDGRAGLRRWAGRLLRWRINWRWYAGTILGVPAALAVTSIPFSGGDIRMPPVTALAAFVPGLIFQMITTGLAEEPGWRDFALPRLQPRFGPLRGNLILGPLWGAWHLPLFLTDWAGPDVQAYTVVEFIATTFTFSLIMTWAFNRTGESLPIAMLMHTSVNNFFSTVWTAIFPSIDLETGSTHVFLIASTVVAVILLVATRGRLGYRRPAGIAGRSEP